MFMKILTRTKKVFDFSNYSANQNVMIIQKY